MENCEHEGRRPDAAATDSHGGTAPVRRLLPVSLRSRLAGAEPWGTWLIFGACLTVVLGAMAWISVTVLRLERTEGDMRAQAVLEENARLALWRADSAMTVLVARENARPYFEYSAFYSPDRAYTRMFSEIQRGEILLPSPLLMQEWPHVLLHFQLGPNGELTSPQAPTGNMRDRAEPMYTTHEKVEEATARLRQLQAGLSRETLLTALDAPATQPVGYAIQTPVAPVQLQQDTPSRQSFLNYADWRSRADNNDGTNTVIMANAANPLVLMQLDLRQEMMSGIWVNDLLVLARQVSVDGKSYVQGCWLDWPGLRHRLTEDVRDLLPEADFVVAETASTNGEWRRLASIPVQLKPGRLPPAPIAAMTPFRVSLLLAWGCVLVAATAVAVLLRGTMALSGRRAAFVSAVTHELRTPLTTFRMYTDMLSEGMVTDEEKRQRYLDTLRGQADRLSHLVENVLAYARLERGQNARRVEEVALSDLLARVHERLAERADQANMSLCNASVAGDAAVRVRVDPSAVEQILLNLVDNACKYAADASDRRVLIEAGTGERCVHVRVRDYGPGIAPKEAEHLFRPFRKSARDAANSAPGVGLGLALSRRLARAMGGDLRVDTAITDGACLVLTLPTA